MIQTTEQEMDLVERKYICGSRVRTRKHNINMEEIYRDFDRGMSWEAVIQKYGVSESTIRRRHKEYQQMVKLLKEKLRNEGLEEELPPLPEDL